MSIPDGFLWGTASSSIQVEGVAPAATWSRWEQQGRVPPSGDGNGFATNFADDFGRYAEFGLTHHRLSLDWARLEPTPGQHDPAAIEHYTEVLSGARDAGVQIWAGLHHFVLPGWFDDNEGGFLYDHARSYYWPRHVDFVAETFGDLIHGWMPVHEPVAYASGGWSLGTLPPGRHDPTKFPQALRATHLANLEAWKLLRSGSQPVATIMDVVPVSPAVKSREPDERAAARAEADVLDALYITGWTRALRDGILALPGLPEEEIPDFVNAFDLIGFSYPRALSVYADSSTDPYPADARVGPQGDAPWPEGLGLTIRRLHDELPGRPLLVSSFGVATPADDPAQDEWRVEVLRDSLREVERAVDDGIDVRGFFHRTATDGYEWADGFDVQFGLFDRDRNPKASARLAAEWAGAVPSELEVDERHR